MHIMISDDSPLFHDLLARRLREDGHEVSQAMSIGETIRQLERRQAPDLILLDIDFSRSHEDSFAGLTAAHTIRRRFPQVALLAMSKHDELRIALEMAKIGKQGGRVGYVLKDKLKNVGELIDHARTVHAGGIFVDASLQGLTSRGGKLTHIQRKVAELISRGHTNRAIAEMLNLSEKAIEKHVWAIRRAYDLPLPKEGDTLQVNIRVLIVISYLSDTAGPQDEPFD